MSLSVSNAGGSVETFFVYAGLAVVGVYVLSLLLHPYVPCERCASRGGTREYGSLFRYGFRPCWVCRGRGVKQRFGASLLGIGERRGPRPNGKVAQGSKNFAKPARTRVFGIF